MQISTILLLAASAVHVNADCYMHNMRGSNNRLNEANANRNNGDRLFDSQNNNRGGYNVGDLNADAFTPGEVTPNDPASLVGQDGVGLGDAALDKDQYPMHYFEDSVLGLEWTVQHGCGGNEADDSNQLNCNMVFQFACNTKDSVNQPALRMTLKDGRNTNTPDTASDMIDAISSQINDNDAQGRGRHESEAWYYECENRQRDQMLFTADQNVGATSENTRQNPNGNRRGLECPEERDYYPYWNPTPFMDIAYLTSNPEDCTAGAAAPFGSFDVTGQSQNNNEVMRCSYEPGDIDVTPGDNAAWLAVAEVRTEEQCLALKATPPGTATAEQINWKGYTHGLNPPDCKQGPWSRANHLGNGRGGQTVSYNWTIPKVDNTALNGVGANTKIYPNDVAKCIIRYRYNISTDDYDVRNTDASSNQDRAAGKRSPVENNPTVDVNAQLQGLRLAINTNQFGRTFQDRSHTFYIKGRNNLAAPVAGEAGLRSSPIRNLNVRGKRGNIVQTFPSTEYDFTPNHYHAAVNEVLHIQWTGSNTHNNGNPAGDGQAGDAGEGTGGTDRHNFVALGAKNKNFPLALDAEVTHAINIIKNTDCYNYNGARKPELDCAVALASGNYYKTAGEANAETGGELSVTLDNAPASLYGGIFLKLKTAGTFNYMCTRNNNFTNRSQKGQVLVA